MKKIISILLLIILTFGMNLGVFAQENQGQLIEKTIYLTYEQYIQKLASEKGISIEEAVKIDKKENALFEKELVKKFPELRNKNISANANISAAGVESEGYYYVDKEWYFVYSANTSFKVAMQATFKNYSYGSFRQICQVLGQSTRRYAGMYNYTWNENYVWYDPSGGVMPTTSITLGGSGYFEVVTTTGGGISGGVPGFEISGTTEQSTTYQSQTVNMQITYSVY